MLRRSFEKDQKENLRDLGLNNLHLSVKRAEREEVKTLKMELKKKK